MMKVSNNKNYSKYVKVSDRPNARNYTEAGLNILLLTSWPPVGPSARSKSKINDDNECMPKEFRLRSPGRTRRRYN